ncbi:MAG: proline--tRNA ligase, partial [Defluviitaleaceae bacterium]|nr:proline--tRNA ligase [Defluviitaleaceae bacterium]
IYQIQTKFRDEARPRAGLIRVREFTMKDGYSYHTSQEDLEVYYDRAHAAYERIFTRVGVPEVISVKSDSGMMGGKVAHEFMLITAAGEDSIVVCEACDYRANLEAAERIAGTISDAAPASLEKVSTPDAKTIEEVCTFLKLPVEQSCKAVMYQKIDNSYVVVFIRGDLEINDTKLRNHIGEEIYPAVITAESGLAAGYTGPYQLSADKLTVLFDRSLDGAQNLCCGANEEGFHYTGFNIERDCGAVTYHDFAKVSDGDICPQCSKPTLSLVRGIELGNIFQLGTKYTEAMGMQYTDPSGNLQYPVMGCYGIGVERTAASICEARHDDYGPIWPMPIAPWQVHLCCVRADDPAVKEVADKLYAGLQAAGIEVIYDDRVTSAGVMFSDADLIGVPVRVVCSPRNLKEGVCEVMTRDKAMQEKVVIGEALGFVTDMVNKLK